MKKRGDWHLELEQSRVGVDHGGRLQHFLHVLAPLHLAAEFVQRVERICHVLGGERLAVAPGDARTGLDGQLLVVGTVLIALCEPHDRLVGEGAVEGERLVDDVAAELRIGADDIRTPEVVLGVLALGAAAHGDERAVARHVLDLACRDRFRDAEQSRRQRQRAGQRDRRQHEIAARRREAPNVAFHP